MSETYFITEAIMNSFIIILSRWRRWQL